MAAGQLVDTDPEQALAHARYARTRAARVGAVREAAGLAAYHAGEWAEALSELRAARRMTGGPGHVAVMADCERALGRPERALELLRGPEAAELPHAELVELRIVAAGARRDMGQLDAAVVALQGPDLDPAKPAPWSARLFYAYADNLAAVGRTDEAIRWFLHAAEADQDEETDAAERAHELSDPERARALAELAAEEEAAENDAAAGAEDGAVDADRTEVPADSAAPADAQSVAESVADSSVEESAADAAEAEAAEPVEKAEQPEKAVAEPKAAEASVEGEPASPSAPAAPSASAGEQRRDEESGQR
ncbi:hypothetical protein SAMN05444320_111127 [Streptoalloteichus hindustanus]|uniref:Tetratricopeptide repeat-containing protein n=1 Tax=Streptoalloteichus hindustanus TaxID=2017 RepID=A0A1M5LKD2_STRHI|nr:hypothetical protein SAMN05444320_111127 [Streptoalloteichus hindustanus]